MEVNKDGTYYVVFDDGDFDNTVGGGDIVLRGGEEEEEEAVVEKREEEEACFGQGEEVYVNRERM